MLSHQMWEMEIVISLSFSVIYHHRLVCNVFLFTCFSNYFIAYIMLFLHVCAKKVCEKLSAGVWTSMTQVREPYKSPIKGRRYLINSLSCTYKSSQEAFNCWAVISNFRKFKTVDSICKTCMKWFVVEVTQNWISESAKSRPELAKSGPEFGCVFQHFVAAFFGARRVQIGTRICAVGKKMKPIFWARFFTILWGLLLL